MAAGFSLRLGREGIAGRLLTFGVKSEWFFRGLALFRSFKAQSPRTMECEGFDGVSLTMTYFHARLCTIIGAVLFHGPVRDGKGWFQDAMVVRL